VPRPLITYGSGSPRTIQERSNKSELVRPNGKRGKEDERGDFLIAARLQKFISGSSWAGVGRCECRKSGIPSCGT